MESYLAFDRVRRLPAGAHPPDPRYAGVRLREPCAGQRWMKWEALRGAGITSRGNTPFSQLCGAGITSGGNTAFSQPPSLARRTL